jgi:hypothetical protein
MRRRRLKIVRNVQKRFKRSMADAASSVAIRRRSKPQNVQFCSKRSVLSPVPFSPLRTSAKTPRGFTGASRSIAWHFATFGNKKTFRMFVINLCYNFSKQLIQLPRQGPKSPSIVRL